MPADADQDNTRLPLLAPEELTQEQHVLYDRMAEGMLPWAQQSGFAAVAADGRLFGPFNAFLYNAELGAASLNYLDTERDATELSARVREVVILTVGAVFESSYELYAHRAVAAKAGLAPADIDALATGQPPAADSQLKPEERIAQRFIRAVAADHRVTPELFAEAQQAFGHKGLVDMIHLAGIYMGVSTMLNAFNVPVPE